MTFQWLRICFTRGLVGFGLFVCCQINSIAQPLLNWQGEWLPGALLVAKLPDNTSLFYAGQPLERDEYGRVLLGISRDAQGRVALEVVDNITQQRWPLSYKLAAREYPTQRVEGVPQATVVPPAEQLARIRREAALVSASRSSSLEQPLYSTGFVAPANGPITGVYGSQRFYNGVAGRPHYGVDYAAPLGAPVRAPAAGKVVLAEPDLFYSGGTVIVDHGYQLFSSFLHMSAVVVEVGQVLQQGELIGAVGATGRATGPHLDWRMNWGSVRVDPQLVLKALPDQVD